MEIPASVTKLGKNAFSLCTSLTTVSFEETAKVEELIGFVGCTSLTSIEIPPSVKTIADRAFSGCTALQSITVPKSVKTLGSSAFGNCTALSSVNFEAGSQLTTLKGGIFSNCSSLRSIELPASVSSFEPNIFENCNKLTTIAVAAENTTYAAENNYVYTKGSKKLFYAAPGITEVTVSGTVAEIASNAFDYCTELTKVTMADGCRSRGSDFSKCTKLTDVAVVHTEGVTEGKFNFSGNAAIKNAVIADGVPSVNYAFSNCTALEQVTLGEGVKKIYSAFNNCSKLPRIHIPASVTKFKGNFSGCISLTELTVDPANAIYASENNCIYEKNLKELLAVAAGLEEVILPDSVKFMSEGNRTFQLHTVLKKLTIGTNLVSFPSGTFADCSALAEVRYKGSPSQWAAIKFENEKANPVYFAKRIYFNGSDTIQKHITFSDIGSDKKVKRFTFINCTDIETIDMKNVQTIEARSFEGCANLESIKLQDVGKGKIFSSAFNRCEKLTKIYYYFDESDFDHKTWTEIEWEDSSWDNCPFKQPYELYFNDTLVKEAKLYRTAFRPITYQNCKSLEKCTVSISNGIANIPETMFADCSNLKSVTFEYTDKVSHIYRGAFLNCNALEEVRYERTIKDWCNISFAGSDANPLKYGHQLYIGKKIGLYEWSYEPVTEPEVPVLNENKSYVFYGANFTKVTFAAGSDVIPDYTFAECKELTKVTIPSSMKTIGQSAFSNCTKLTTIEFEGTSAEWNGIKKEKEWNMGIPATAVKCLGDNVDVQL
ncbi:leucine-rich repeat protein [Treponema socranskii]|nr:leucine-rich repeat protein [Treponema socranskii]MDR9858843.1 leucine-rich repeat protein [Treponema socranskii]